MRLKVAWVCCMLAVVLAVVEAAPKSPWRKKRSTDVCMAEIPDCKTCTNPNMQCDDCSGQRIISDDGLTCIDCPTNADMIFSTVNAAGNCIARKCRPEYRLDSVANTCSKCIDGCSRCDVDITVCDVDLCLKGFAFEPQTKTCTRCPTYCANCSYPAVANGTTAAIHCDACNNMTYNAGTTCMACPVGCKKVDSSSCSGTIGCKQCLGDYYISTTDSTGLVTCAACNSRCSSCDSTGKCGGCKSQYHHLVSDTCQTCSELGVSNCMVCEARTSGSGWQCKTCVAGYIPDTTLGVCKSCADNCVTCKSNATTANPESTLCETCPLEFTSSVVGLTVKAVCDKCPEHCTKCTLTSAKLTRCSSGYCESGYTTNGDGSLCLKCPSDCSNCEYDTGLSAAVCSVGKCNARTVRNDITKMCMKCSSDCAVCKVDSSQSPKCVSCDPRFGLDHTALTCKACPSSCKYCKVDINGVATCQEHGCADQYYRTSLGKCDATNINYCDYSIEQGKCQVCNPGYTRSPTTFTCSSTATAAAASCSSGCATCTGSVCNTCSNTALSPAASIMCLALIGCSDTVLSGIQLSCGVSSCATGTTYANGVCIKCPLNCATCTFNTVGKTVCSACITTSSTKYANPVNGLCQPCAAHCTSCTGANAGHNLCDNNCDVGYFFENNLCKPCFNGDSCATCSGVTVTGLCLTCSTGFKEVTTGSSKVCTECPTGMRTNTQGIQEKVSFCTNCNTLVTDCATCKHGYVPDPTNSDAQQKCAECPAAGDFNVLVTGTPNVCKVKDGMCRPGFVMDTNRDCIACPEGSMACYLTGVVTAPTKTYKYYCKEGYVYVASSDSCQACGAGCNRCATPGNCDADGCINHVATGASPVGGNTNRAYTRDSTAVATASGVCPQCASNCYQCSTSAQCDSGQCYSGYYFNTTSNTCGACTDEVSNCNACTMQSLGVVTCTGCSDNYTPVLTTNVITSCLSCSASSYCSTCTTANFCTNTDCIAKYYWNLASAVSAGTSMCHPCGTTLVTDPPGCSTCSTSGVCTTCDLPGFADAPTAITGICAPCPASTNCNRCTAANTALCTTGQCKTGYYYFGIANSLCVACSTLDTNCATCTDVTVIGATSVCSTCAYGYRLDGTTCVRVSCGIMPTPSSTFANLMHGQINPGVGTICPTAPPAGLAGCPYYMVTATSSGSYKCPIGGCAEGYVWYGDGTSSPSNVKQGLCQACAAGCANCRRLSATSTECLASGCEYEYARTTAGLCQKCPIGCTECVYDSTLTKTVCLTGTCITQYAEVPKDSCLGCPVKALTCANSTELVMSYSSCDPGWVHHESNYCFKCPANCQSCTYDRTSSSTTCLACNSLFALNPADSVCYACTSGCSACTYDAGRTGTKCDLDKCNLGTAQDPITMDCNACQDSNCKNCYNYDGRSCMPDGCNTEFYWNLVNGVGVCGGCTANCLYCMDSNMCDPEGCDAGYVRSPAGSCIVCTPTPGCDKCTLGTDNVTTTCTACKANHATKLVSNVITECEACPTGCNGCSFTTTTSGTSKVYCTTCVDGYYKESTSVDGCTGCPANSLTCTMSGSQVQVTTCKPKFGKNLAVNPTECKSCGSFCQACDALYTTCATCVSNAYIVSGTCNACTANCLQCDASGCSSGQCMSMYRRNQKADNTYECQRCTDPNCLQCDTNVGICANCPLNYYEDGVGCTKCPGNCPDCDINGCKTCAAGWIVNAGQCINCPKNCLECQLDTNTQTVKCLDHKCKDGYSLNDTKLECFDCETQTGIPKCHLCTDKASSNKSSCLGCKTNYILSDDNSTCHDCTTINNCNKCIDRPRICSECDNGLNMNRNSTVCGTLCLKCNGKCSPGLGETDVNYYNITEVFCPEYCMEKKYYSKTSKNKIDKHMYSSYGCANEFDPNAMAGTAGCREESTLCAQGNDEGSYMIKYCCGKGYTGSDADRTVPMSLRVLLYALAVIYLLTFHG